MIIAYLTHDLRTIKACSLICRSWYPAAAKHLHHTLTLRRGGRGVNRSQLEPLSKLHKLGLLPLVKEIRIDQGPGLSCWFVPRAFNHHFSALANIHTLKLENMEIHRFIPGIKCISDTSRQHYNPSRCMTHAVPLNNCHISSPFFQTWTTLRSGSPTPTCTIQPSLIQGSFHTPHQSCEGGWCFLASVGLKP